MKGKSKISESILAVIVIGVLAFCLLMSPLGLSVRTGVIDFFADSVSGEEIVQYQNQTFWFNETIWVNNTEWYNQTYWINTTSYYPFETGWNNSGSNIYMRLYENEIMGPDEYRMSYYNQLTLSVQTTPYESETAFRSRLNTLLGTGALAQIQYDCALIQLYILVND